jgi:hypothetical protein
MTIEHRIELAAEHLPEGWQIEIGVERGSAWVKAIRPDGSETIIDDGESSLEELFRDAFIMAQDEHAASSANTEASNARRA